MNGNAAMTRNMLFEIVDFCGIAEEQATRSNSPTSTPYSINSTVNDAILEKDLKPEIILPIIQKHSINKQNVQFF